MKIAIDIREADGEKTGKGFYAYGIVAELLKLDHQNQYLLYTNKAESPFPKQNNVQIRQISFGGFKWHLKVLSDLKKEKVDIYFSPTSYIIPALAPKRIKTIITVHDLVSFLFPHSHQKKAVLIERITLRIALKRTAKVLTVSENTAIALVKIFKLNRESITETPCAPHQHYFDKISETIISKTKQKYNLPDKFILGVGTLEPRKNFINLIKAFVIVRRELPDYKLVIVGKKGWKYHEIKETVQQFKLQNEIIFTGYVKDEELPVFYHSASVFIFPSLYEGFGIPPLEAMACGCPVVSSNAASLPEVIGEAGLLIDPKSSNKIADSIISLLENEQVRNMLIERGREHTQKFNWKISAEILFEEIKKLNPTNPVISQLNN